MKCKHEAMTACIKFSTGERYSRCLTCHKIWHDNGKRAREYDKKTEGGTKENKMKEMNKKELLKAIKKHIEEGVACVGCNERFSPLEINSSNLGDICDDCLELRSG